MLFQIPELGKHVWISAFQTRPDDVDQVIGAIREQYPDVCVQIVDLNKVAGSRYLFLAVLNALKSFGSKRPISKTLGMEVLLYVAASRQISEAIKLVGVSADTSRIAVLAIGNSTDDVSGVGGILGQILHRENSDVLIDEWPAERIREVRSTFSISPREIRATVRRKEPQSKAIERLAIERSALLTIKK